MILALKVGEIFSIGGLTTFLGITITFLTLTLLVFCLIGMEKLFTLKSKKNDAQDIAIEEEQPDISNNQEDDSVIAAIVAAINLVLIGETKSQNKAKASFVVKSIKRI